MKPFPLSEITILGCTIFDDLMIKNSFKVYLVVGGVQGLNAPGNTAETLIDSDSGPYEWKTIEPLPISTYGLKAVHYENTVLTFGKNTCHIYIFMFKASSEKCWWLIVPAVWKTSSTF